ncbi:MAG TPA: glutathione S-transferase N-terminal domain-containing protein [Telluria sp.]|nr:glutathione S-transferase N-terminal domain-containing protein [Telluria sp.]
MVLYGRRSSINVQKVIWCLAELGLVENRDYRRIDAGLAFGIVDTPEYLALNPNGLVPTLVDGEVVLWESNTIVRYLAASRGNTALLPAAPGERADVERWMDWQSSTFWATLRIAFLGLTRTPLAQRNEDAIKNAYRLSSTMLKILDAVLAKQPFVTPTGFTVADIGLALAVHRWMALAEDFSEVLEKPPAMPALQDWHQRVTARPAFLQL